jgi:hypothetical protein
LTANFPSFPLSSTPTLNMISFTVEKALFGLVYAV